MESILLISTLVITIMFMVLTYLIYRKYFYAIIYPLNAATRIFFVSSLIGSGLNLYSYNESGIALLNYHQSTAHLGLGIGIYLLGVFICFCFNMILFRITLLVNKISIFDNERAALAKGDLLIAGIQSITFLIFIFLLSEPMIQLILKMVQ